MKDLLGLMSKAKEMQAKMQVMQEEIAAMVSEGHAGGGAVVVTLTGKGEMKGLKIDPSLFREDDVEIFLLVRHVVVLCPRWVRRRRARRRGS